MNLNTDCWYILFYEIMVNTFISLSSKRFYTGPPTIPKEYCLDKLNLLKKYINYYISRNGHIVYSYYICQRIATKGSINCIEWAIKRFPWDEWTIIGAATHGHLELLKWFLNNGLSWEGSQWACAHIAEAGQLEILKWAKDNGCPWNGPLVHAMATQCVHSDIVKWNLPFMEEFESDY